MGVFNLSTSLQLINHASILINHGEISLLSDPWYQGDAFHKGWNLIHELTDDEIINLLDQVTHIWISHEHPDHFSILFFKKFGNKIGKTSNYLGKQGAQHTFKQSFKSKSVHKTFFSFRSRFTCDCMLKRSIETLYLLFRSVQIVLHGESTL